MYTKNELMFPHYAIPAMRNLRGGRWKALVERIMPLPEYHEEKLAFMLLMIRINGCMSCETDSYRAMRGCTACAVQTLRRYKSDDDELLEIYEQALTDIQQFRDEIDRDDTLASIVYQQPISMSRSH
jgi:hypothetical protein